MAKIKKNILVFGLGLLSFSVSVDSKITFSQVNSSLVISDTLSQININSTLPGWKNSSIVNGAADDAKDDFDFFAVQGGSVAEEFIFEGKRALGSIAQTGFLYYDKVTGSTMDQITIGGAGEIWGSQDSYLYKYDVNGYSQDENMEFPWHPVGIGMLNFSAGRDGTLWGISDGSGGLSVNKAYQWESDKNDWKKVRDPHDVGFSGFAQIEVGDIDNVWALGVVSGLVNVFRWGGASLGWVNKSVGSFPNYYDSESFQTLGVGGDGVVYGVTFYGAGPTYDRDLVKWDGDTWNVVPLKIVNRISGEIETIGTEDLGNIAVGEIESVWATVKDPIYYDSLGVYNAHRLTTTLDSGGSTVYVLRPQLPAVDKMDIGFYGEVWMHDSLKEIWYRLFGGAVRSATNYLSLVPLFEQLDPDYEFPKGSNKSSPFTIFKSINLDTGSIIYIPIGYVASPMNLNGGLISLQGDLHMSSTTYIKTGGRIDGNGYAMILGGNMGLPPGEYLKFVSDTILDGRNKDFVLGNGAQLIVDSGVTLTLKNIILKNVNDLTVSSFVMTGTDSNIAFKNVKIALSGNYTFTQGHLFIHDDVVVTGTSKFIYESNQESYIDNDGCLSFDFDTTFCYKPTGLNRKLIVMTDVTSKLSFNGSRLEAPSEVARGIELTNGTLILDNAVEFENLTVSGTANSLNNRAITIGDGVSASNNLDVYLLSGATVNTEGVLDYNNV